MKIVVVNTAASSGGALSILKDFYNNIKSSDDDNKWIFILSDNYIEETKNIKVIVNKDIKRSWLNRLKWEFLDSKKFINNLEADIVFSMQNTIGRGINGKKIIYLHQSIPFQDTKRFSLLKREERIFAIYQYVIGALIKQSLKRVDRVIVQSEWMKKAVENKVNIKPNKVYVVPPTVNITYRDLEELSINNKKFFYPASSAIYKNHKCAIEAINKLIKEGFKDFEVEFTLNDEYYNILEITPEMKGIVKLSGSLSREEVFKRYKKSVLIFPSYIETFGLPILESRNLGGLILASECDFSKEILDKYENKYYFNPFDSDELANLMKKVLTQEINFIPNKSTHYEFRKNGWDDVIKVICSLKEGV